MIKKYILAAVAIALAIWIGFFFGKKAAVAPEQPVSSSVSEVATTTPVVQPAKKTTTTIVAPKTGSAGTLTKDGSYYVSYTDSGFVPKSASIKSGKSVHFVNNSNKAMSIVTTVPDSQVFGELNQGKTVGRGGTYDFTFLSVGTWSYMNRNNQADRGTIIVQ